LLPRDRGCGPHRDVHAAHRVGPAGELVEQQFRARVRERDGHAGQREVKLLGHHHRDGRRHALADLGPGHRERRGPVGVDDDRDQAACRRGGEVLHVAEVEDLLRLWQRGHRSLGRGR
jgi:hypothetical protein